MECPQGTLIVGKDDSSSMTVVQESCQDKKSGFIGGNIDPCLYVKKSEKSIVNVALHVDSNFMIGDIEAILKIVEGLQDYLSCKVKFSMDKRVLG